MDAGCHPRAGAGILAVALAILMVGACWQLGTKAGDGGTNSGGDALAGGGTGGSGVGSPAPDGGSTSGGGGGTYGGGIGDGGIPSACSDPALPVSCPEHNGVPATVCWSPGTSCSTIAKCGDQFFSCTSPNAQYDCAQMRCLYTVAGVDGGVECGDPAYPVACPGTAEVPQMCWSPGTKCSTLSRCGDHDFRSCIADGYRFNCATSQCLPYAGGTPDASSSTPDASSASDTAAPDATADTTAGDAQAIY